MSEPLILYDITRANAKDRSWSPNTWKTRLNLNYKRIPYRTVWVEYADIQHLLKDSGASPTDKRPDGTDRYSLPAIQDPATGQVITESFAIAQYLDKKYPDRPVIPAGTDAQQSSFAQSILVLLGPEVAMVLYNSWVGLSDRSKPAFERLMRDKLGAPPFAEWPVPTGQQFEGFGASLTRVAEALDKNGGRNGHFVGDSISFADLVVGAHIEWFRRTLTAEQFERLLEMNQGRWKKLVDELAEFTYVDEGDVYQGQQI